MRIKPIYLALLVLASAIASCQIPKQKKNTVWDDYDVRTPVPYDSQVDPSAATQLRYYDPYALQPYTDNDAYYAPPRIQCGIRDLPACGE